jgi:hypothetical protein
MLLALLFPKDELTPHLFRKLLIMEALFEEADEVKRGEF